MVKIKSLGKDIFPYYIPPFKNELFTSWFCRLSVNHDLKPQSFVLNYLGKSYPFWNRDIDVSGKADLKLFIEAHTPLGYLDIENLFLKSFECFAFETINEKGITNNILSIGVNHRKRTRNGQLFCFNCLQENPYFKKEWRLMTSIICVKCRQYLKDSCSICGASVAFHRLFVSDNRSTMNYKTLKYCHNCNSDLSIQIPVSSPNKVELDYQIYINNAITRGFSSKSQYSFQYINVLLHVLQSLLSGSSRKTRFQTSFKNYFIEAEFNTSKDNKYFSSLEQRIILLPLIHQMLVNQSILEEVIIDGGLYRSYLDPENKLPFWFIRIFNK